MTSPDVTLEEKCLFDLQGFLIIRGVLTPDECATLLAATRRREREELKLSGGGDAGMEDLAAHRLNGMPQIDPVFDIPIAHPRVTPYLREFLAAPQLGNTWSITKGPRAKYAGWHRALPSADYSCRNGQVRTHILNTGWMLTDNPPSSGGLGVLPGSHKNNIELDWAKYEGLTLPGSIEVTGRAGDVVVFSECLIHTGLKKTTPGLRTNLYCNYSDLYLSGAALSDPANLHVYCFTPELRSRFNAEQKEITKWMEHVTPRRG